MPTATSPAPRSALAVRHVPFEDLGLLEPLLRERGWRVDYVEAGLDDLGALDPAAPDLLVVLGGPIGAWQDDVYPFLKEELGLLERRLAADRPTLGICLGGQLMARALGGRVYPGPGKEIGWGPLALTAAGHRSPLRHLAPELTPVLHWHGDTFDLPRDAVRLASTANYDNQAFAWGRAALGVQFHAEVTARGLERWFIGHAYEIDATPGLTVPGLRADTARWGATLTGQGRRCFTEWLEGLG